MGGHQSAAEPTQGYRRLDPPPVYDHWMHSRLFPRLNQQVSEVGYGLWGMGGWSGSNDDESIAALDRAVELGCTFFDTALAYGNGKSEQLLAPVLARHRDKSIVVATKIPGKNLKWPALPSYSLDEVFPADHIRACTETSLRNLDVETIDVQQFHVWTDEWADDDRWQRAVDDLKREKLVRAFGISVNRWEPANVLKAIKTGLIDSVQVVYNLFDQNPEDELFPMCREHDVAVIARVPFDEGSLTGTLRPETTFPEGDWRNLYFTPDALKETLERVDALTPDIPSGMTLPELALRFILASPDVTTVIPGMRKVRHVEANLDVSDGTRLSPIQAELLKRHRWVRTHMVP
jgi:aryl-alcohol dehydrogenase-like predicted oxidoreductase